MLHNGTQPLLKKQFSHKTILFVKDNADTAELHALAISSETTNIVLLVANGREALQILKDIIPNLILLDDHLPEIDGLAFYDLLRSTKGQEETSIAFLSASPPLDGVNEIGYREVVQVKKPFELNDLLAVIRGALAES